MSIQKMTDDAKSIGYLEEAAADRREAAETLASMVEREHRAVWAALDAGASWRDLAWLVGEPLGTLYHRHRDRGHPRVGRAS